MSTRFISLISVAILIGLGVSTLQGEVPPPNVVWWQFDEEVGDLVEDSSGNHRTGVINGAVRTPGGVGGVGGCLEFLGSGEMVEDVTAPDYLNGLEAITVALWIKSDAVGTDAGFLWFSIPSGGDNGGMRYDAASWKWEGGTNLIKLSALSGTQQLESSDGLQATRWQHVTMVWSSGEELRLYVDGVLDAPRGVDPAREGTLDGVTTLIVGKGAKDDAADRGWDGLIDDVRIYDYALTPEQIAELATTNLPRLVKAMNPQPANGALDVVTPLLQWTAGETAVFHNVYLGPSPELTEADLVMPLTIGTIYYHVAGLEPGTTYYWRVDEVEADMTTVHTGNVWTFIARPFTAYVPKPADGANEEPPEPNQVLAWQPGREAVEHQVYFGGAIADVSDGAANADQGTVSETSLTLSESLAPLTTYYWRVDEIDTSGTVQAGPVWAFSTYRSVDDFESYTDDEGSRIYETWIDGWTNGSGSLVGYLAAPFAEQTIVHAGAQAMPLEYNNAIAPFYSEAEREFAPTQDWTANGAEVLVLYVRGGGKNGGESLYVAVGDASNQVAAVSHPDPGIARLARWVAWRVPLSQFADGGVDLTRVKRLIIGLGNRDAPVSGDAGLLFLDSIRLTRSTP